MSGSDYRSVDDKVKDIERYLVLRVDQIRRLAGLAVVLAAVAAVAAAIWLW